jgi:hypothetical protein
MEGKTRPSTIEVMALVNAIGAISILLFGWLVGSAPSPILTSVSLGDQYWTVMAIFIVFICLSVLGTWIGQKWGYALTYLTGVLYLVAFVLFADGIALIVGIMMFYYVSRPLVKDWLQIKMTV